MRFTSLCFSCLLCLSAVAQPNPINRRAMAITGLASSAIQPPSSIAGMFRYWVSSDVALNVTVSNQWNDRIIGAHAWEMDTTKSPTNSAKGVRYNGSQFLTNDHTFVLFGSGSSSPWSVFLVFGCDASGLGGIIASAGGTGEGFFENGANTEYFGFNTSYNVFASAANQFYDVEIAQDSAGHLTWYTNGVSVKSDGTTFNDYTQERMGEDTFFYKGWVTEFGVWTNVTFTAGNLTTLHTYATNTYGTNISAFGNNGIHP